MGQAGSGHGGGVSMNHFMAAYLVPLVKANSKIHDVTLHVLNASSDLQDAQTHLDIGHVPEDKHSLSVMNRENILKVLDLGAARLSRRDFQKIPRTAEEIMLTIAEAPEEADPRFKLLEFLNTLGSKQATVATELDRSYVQRQERQHEDDYAVKILEGLIDYINDHPNMKVLDALFAKDFSRDSLTRDFTRTYNKLKELIDERELEVTVKVISVKSSQGRIMEELLS